jgi:hypothetical protein
MVIYEALVSTIGSRGTYVSGVPDSQVGKYVVRLAEVHVCLVEKLLSARLGPRVQSLEDESDSRK